MPEAKPFTTALMLSEISVFRRLYNRLDKNPLVDRAEFSDLMAAMFERGRLDPKRAAEELGYSQSAVYRWIDGSTAPHVVAWPAIVEWIKARLNERIEAAGQDVDEEERDFV